MFITAFFIIISIGFIVLCLLIAIPYNLLVGSRNKTKMAWHQISVQLKRRHDLIPNLVETVRGYLKFEQDTLEKVIQARAKAVNASSVQETAKAESVLNASLGRLLAVF